MELPFQKVQRQLTDFHSVLQQYLMFHMQIHISCRESVSRLINLNCFCGQLETPQQTDKQTKHSSLLAGHEEKIMQNRKFLLTSFKIIY